MLSFLYTRETQQLNSLKTFSWQELYGNKLGKEKSTGEGYQ
jgi:hypothetical protein